MTASTAPAQPLRAPQLIRTLVLLGVGGDLSGRLLLPGIASLLAEGGHGAIRLVGFGAAGYEEAAFRQRLVDTLGAAEKDADAAGRKDLRATIEGATLRTGDATDPATLAELSHLDPGHTALFFALPPQVTQKGLEGLAPGQLAEGTVLVLEKPFGHDTASARELNDALARLLPEDQIFRVDHFLAKSTVLNILGMRFANRFVEKLLTAEDVESIDIVYDENLALEDRAGYYDGAGALRDMIQSHLLQIMAFLLMEQPSTLNQRDLRDAVATLLRATSLDGTPAEASLRARYTAGIIGERHVPDYTAEKGVDASRGTETMAQLRLRVNNSRWAGVPIRVRSGKAVGTPRKEIVVTFKPVAYLPRGFTGCDTPTRLRIGLSPETLRLEIDVNGPGDPFRLDRVELSTALSKAHVQPYGEVISAVLAGDLTLSVRGDVAEECWRIVDPVLGAWAEGEVPMSHYPAGSQGPSDWPLAPDEASGGC